MKAIRWTRIVPGVAVAAVAAALASLSASVPPSPDVEVHRAARAAPAEDGDFRVNFRVDAWTHIAKVGSAVKLGPGRFKAVIKQGKEDPARPGVYPTEGTLTMPPADGYFVVFKFVPVRNRTTLAQVGTATGTTDMNDMPTVRADVSITVDLVISDVFQDAVPLDVGRNCRTRTPVTIAIKGDVDLSAPKITPAEPNPRPAATIEARYPIPPFAGCGVAEDLSPLLTGLVSGPDNVLRTELRLECIACPA